MSLSKKKPLVSICIPAYNNESYIKNTIQCIINQTYDNWELIITDDFSTDSTLKIIQSYKNERITIIKNNKNLGLVGNWNKVIKEAKGEFIKLLCGDDLISLDCLEKQVQIFLSGKYPTVSLVTSYRNIINNEGKVLMIRKFPFRSGFILSKQAISFNLLFGTNIIGEPCVGLFKRTAFTRIGEYDESNGYAVDLDYWFRILLLGDLYVIPEPLASFRISKDATTSKIKKNQAKLFRQFAKKIYYDKRFKVGILQYYFACMSSAIIYVLRRSFMYFYLGRETPNVPINIF